MIAPSGTGEVNVEGVHRSAELDAARERLPLLGVGRVGGDDDEYNHDSVLKSRDSVQILDLWFEKGERWRSTGILDVQVYRKPTSNLYSTVYIVPLI